MDGLAPGSGLYAALLSPQGKILFDFFVAEGDGALLLDVARDVARGAAQKTETVPAARQGRDRGARHSLASMPDLRAIRRRPTTYADAPSAFADPRLAALGVRSIGAMAEMPADLPGPRAYHAARLALGVPEGGDFGSEKIFALDAGLDELHAVSFDKGCYVGQELTSRMKHRGTARKRILTVTAEAALPRAGRRVTARRDGDRRIVSVYGAQALPWCGWTGWTKAAAKLMVGEIPVALTRPAWLADAGMGTRWHEKIALLVAGRRPALSRLSRQGMGRAGI